MEKEICLSQCIIVGISMETLLCQVITIFYPTLDKKWWIYCNQGKLKPTTKFSTRGNVKNAPKTENLRKINSSLGKAVLKICKKDENNKCRINHLSWKNRKTRKDFVRKHLN